MSDSDMPEKVTNPSAPSGDRLDPRRQSLPSPDACAGLALKSDAEAVCEFMEPRPAMPRASWLGMASKAGWWRVASGVRWDPKWHPAPLTLDALHWVAAKLIGLGYRDKIDHELSLAVWKDAVWAASWHATAEQKIAALASVIRAGAAPTVTVAPAAKHEPASHEATTASKPSPAIGGSQ